MKSFDEAIKLVDDIMSKQNSRLPELGEALRQKFVSANKQVNDVYDILEAIIAREGGNKVSFKDGGRACFITPLEGDRIKIEYKCDFSSIAKLNDAIIVKGEADVIDPVENFEKLSLEFKNLEHVLAACDLAKKVIDAYVSYQNSLANHRASLISNIVGNDDDDDPEKSYW